MSKCRVPDHMARSLGFIPKATVLPGSRQTEYLQLQSRNPSLRITRGPVKKQIPGPSQACRIRNGGTCTGNRLSREF